LKLFFIYLNESLLITCFTERPRNDYILRIYFQALLTSISSVSILIVGN